MRNRPVLLCIAALTAVILILPILFPLPPLPDYPNHLARIWLIAGGVDVAPVNTFYFEDWHAVGAGIGIDLVAKLLSPFVGPFTIGTILLVAAMLLPPLGAIALNARLFRGPNVWQPFFLLFWCTQTMIGGLLNFQIGLGLAMVAVAAETKVGRHGRWALYGLRLAAVFALMLIHPYGLFFYAVVLAATRFGSDWPSRQELPRRLRQAVVAAAVCLIPIVFFFLRVRGVPGAEDKLSGPALFNDLTGVIRALASPFASYDMLVDLVFALPLTALVVWGVFRRKFEIHAGLFVAACILATIALFMPATLGHTGWIDKRFPLMALLAALAATRLDVSATRQKWLLAAAAVLVVARTVWIGLNWNAGAELVQSIREALNDVPAGARVLAMQHENTERDGLFHVIGRTTATLDETYRHFPAMMIPWRHAFTPMLFAQPREKPILLKPPFDGIANPTGGVLPSVHALDNSHLITPRLTYIKNWRANFDWILVLNADRPDRNGPFHPPPGLELVTDKGFAQLWRVRKDSR